jgi:hypothetical protein
MAAAVRKKQLLKQSSKLAQAQSYPTLIQSKGYKYLLYKALETLRPGSIHECSAYELRQAMGFHDYKELQAAIEGLSAVQIRWETLGRWEHFSFATLGWRGRVIVNHRTNHEC